MKIKQFFIVICVILLLAACGGSSADESSEPAAEQQQEEIVEEVQEEVVEEPTEEVVEEVMEEEEMEEESDEAMEAEDSEEMTEESSEEMAEEAEEEMAEEEMAEEETAVGFGDIAMSGIDSDSGLEINPASYGPGDTFIVRGTVISMNLTPITSPEFLIESPEGVRYRVKTQPLDETFFIDGTQWQPFEYRQGVGAMVTIEFDPSLTTSDIPSGSDLTLVMQE